MANGILIVDKPAGWTSQDVAAKLRGVFHERRIGHSGTLDPMATGVLVLFVGRATRAVEFAERDSKEYLAGLRLGLVTNTQDTSGETLETHPAAVTREELDAALDAFRGDISQIPPMYSAIKIGGKKLYELARKGQEVERKPRNITIFELAVEDGSGSDWDLRVRCSKGTYVRTLCHDIGQSLGCGGCMSSLRRTRAGRFTLEQAVTMEQILEFAKEHDPAELLMPVDGGMVTYPTLEQKKAIIENTVGALRAMGYDCPKVGVLACVEKLNPKMPETVEGDALKQMNQRGELTGCVVEGPISYDCAVSREIAAFKGFESPCAGDCDVLVAPNIHAGNIMGKMLTVTCKAKMAGFIVGARCPIVMTSRGSSAEEKYLSIALAGMVAALTK